MVPQEGWHVLPDGKKLYTQTFKVRIHALLAGCTHQTSRRKGRPKQD